MSTTTETGQDGAITEAGLAVLGAFAEICGAPDDPEVARRANEAFATLEGLAAGRTAPAEDAAA